MSKRRTIANPLNQDGSGLITKPLVMKNDTAIRAEVAPGGGWKDILNMTPTGAMKVGSGSARLSLYSSEDPQIEIDGIDYKLYSEHFPPPAAGVAAFGLLNVTPVLSSGTFSLQAGTKGIIVEMVGGGGGSVTPPCP